MATRKPEDDGASLPFAALQLLAPPVRLVSAALWKVIKRRDVMRYGVVEEFVTSACETVPGLLTLRHQGKLALGLRGRLILELCSNRADGNAVLTHLERIRAPAVQSLSSAASVKRDLKVQKTVESFHLLVRTLLADPAEREQFFKEEFPVEYGPKFDQELEKLLWEFLIRVDQFLPAPNLAQTVSWLSETPSVLEECARAATQPQLLKVLLQHETCLGHLEAAASLPPNMGDSILTSLSLPPSGRRPTDRTQKKDAAFLSPAFGTVSNEDVSVLPPAGEKRENPRSAKRSEDDGANEGGGERTGVAKRKQPDGCESDEEEDVPGNARSGKKKRRSKSLRNGSITIGQAADGAKSPDSDPAILETRRGAITVSRLDKRPEVAVKRRSETSTRRRDRAAKSSRVEEQNERNRPQKPDSDKPGPDDKENDPTIPSASGFPSQQHGGTEAEDYVADSEDEATKNFKDRLFVRRYIRTKHGTYVPTLREYWKPGKTRQHLLSANCKHR
ncbi:TERF1-interacting nuclear factor 2 [Brachionichthys hirsutus]|uniref:TERF1-interacting nuclear factor 2 n=1 Tax=Brachionichthys hirsutus TaxID=412623 RepID=UPI00360467CF